MRRQGFTLVELLVAMALIVLIMSVISQAFVEGLESFRQLKGLGDLQERLRTAVVPLREDLIARHLNGATGPVRLSELGPPPLKPAPTEGFFRIEQGNAPLLEGFDSDLVPSYSATSHALLFTVFTGAGPSSRRTDWLSTPLLPGITPAAQTELATQQGPVNFQDPAICLSPWMEVAWFLAPMLDPATGQQVLAAGGTTPLYTLHRRVRLLVVKNTAINSTSREVATNYGLYPEISCKPDAGLTANFLYFNSPTDVAQLPLGPARRGGMNTTGPAPVIDRTPLGSGPEGATFIGQDRVLADVISFQVQVLPGVQPVAQPPVGYGFTDISGGVYDTATTPAANLQIRALQITIRVWDYKTEQTRQITVIQDM